MIVVKVMRNGLSLYFEGPFDGLNKALREKKMRFKYECEVMSLRTQNWELHFMEKTVREPLLQERSGVWLRAYLVEIVIRQSNGKSLVDRRRDKFKEKSRFRI